MSQAIERCVRNRRVRWTRAIRLLLAVFAPVALLATTALAQTKLEAHTKVAAGMSPIDVLVIAEAIRQNWADYTLLIDGGGDSNTANYGLYPEGFRPRKSGPSASSDAPDCVSVAMTNKCGTEP
jgi:hypothetical protein